MQVFRYLLTFLTDILFPPRDTELTVRRLLDDALVALLDPRIYADASIPIVYILPYLHEAVSACVRENKFHDDVRASQLLGHALGTYLLEGLSDFVPAPILIPMPLSVERARERGYNQVERIAGATQERMPYLMLSTDLLVRTRNTKPQTSLSGDLRRTNMLGAFKTTQLCNPERTYIVLDDVTTTGSTLTAAVEALKTAGAQHVLALALAH